MRHLKVMGAFTIAMVSVSAILNVRGLPMMASLGYTGVFFYLVAFLTFLLPASLICAELATHYPKNGGVYTWSKRAFGNRVGVLVMWMEWSNNIIAIPTTLSTIVLTLSYIGFPALMHNKGLIFTIILVILWIAVFYNILGVRASSRLNVLGALLGTILPGIFIILLGIIATRKYGLPHLHMQFIPDLNIHHLAIFITALSAYAGMQVTAFHAENVKNPEKAYPRGLISAAVIIFLLTSLGVCAIFSVVPPEQINIINGVIQAFNAFFQEFHLLWFVPILALLIAFGGLSSFSAWLVGLARGLREMMIEHDLYPTLTKINKGDMPHNLLILEGVIATLLASCFLWMPSLNSAFWLLIALTSQFTVLVYIVLFASVIKLRLQRTEKYDHAYTIPGGKLCLYLLAGLGILVSVIAFIFGLFPLDQGTASTSTWHYVVMMIAGDIVILLLPLILFKKLRT